MAAGHRIGAQGADAEAYTPFRVEVRHEREVVLVCPIGEIDLASVGLLRSRLDEVKAAGFEQVVLDLRGVTFLDSSGLHLVTEADAAAVADGSELALIAGPAAVQRAFEVTGLLERLTFVDGSRFPGVG